MFSSVKAMRADLHGSAVIWLYRIWILIVLVDPDPGART